MRPRQIFDQNFTSNNIANKALYASTLPLAGWRPDTFRILDQIPVRTIGSATLHGVARFELLASKEVASHRVPAALAKDVTLPRAGPYLRGRRRQKRHSEREAEVGIDVLRGRVAARRAARTSCFGARPRGGYGADPLAAIKVRSSQIHGSTVTIRARPMRAACGWIYVRP